MHYEDVKGVLSNKNGMNLYRGCQHGCIYCDSRSTVYNMDHEFEDILVKRNALDLLEAELKKRRRKTMIGTGSMCDPYMPLEKAELLTRGSLILAEKYGFGFTLITKSDLVLRDLDLLKKINEKTKCVVQMTLTTYDEQLCKIIEPNVATTRRRSEVLNILKEEGIPSVVWLCPILPFINDSAENLLGILSYCKQAQVKGILCFGAGVTLREGDREYFYSKLDQHFPGMKSRYIKSFGNAYYCPSPDEPELMRLFTDECKKSGIMYKSNEIFAYLNEYTSKTEGEQLSMF